MALGVVAVCVFCVVAGAALGLAPCVFVSPLVVVAAELLGLVVASCWLCSC